MPNPLLNLFNDSYYNTANSTPSMVTPRTDTETLPNGGGTYNPSEGGKITPTTPAPVTPVTTPPSVFNGGATTTPPVTTPAPAAPVTPEPSFYDKYRDPKTGDIMSPEEYAIYLGNKIPKGSGDVTNYAGDALAKPNETEAQLKARATNLNNARNDLVTGTTDPYKVGTKSGIAYSPQELKAIENAYAGIYDPVLNDVFSRLDEKQKEEAKRVKREDKIFATNESIRQWQATTGTRPVGGTKTKSTFTQSQLNNGASNAGLSLSTFDSLDDDIKNFYINTPKALNDEDKKVPIYENFEEDFDRVLAGDLSADQLSEDIMGSTLPESVKHYFIEQIPAEPEKKKGWLSNVWGAITGN